MAIIEPFHYLVKRVMKANGVKTKDLVLDIEASNKFSLSTRTLQRYFAGTNTPDFNTAKFIIEFLNITMTDDEIADVLSATKAYVAQKKNNSELKQVQKHVTFNLEEFKMELGIDSPEEIMDIINQRVDELYGESDRSGFGHYLRDLIINDVLNETLN